MILRKTSLLQCKRARRGSRACVVSVCAVGWNPTLRSLRRFR